VLVEVVRDLAKRSGFYIHLIPNLDFADGVG
jgi:hypothetical protein